MLEKTATISPTEIVKESIKVADLQEHEIKLCVYSDDGKQLLCYQPAPKEIEKTPEAATAALEPEEITTQEELYLTGLHIEQYRHATYLPDPYYLEGLKRDPLDSRINTAYGQLLLRRGLFAKSEIHFRKAIQRITWKNPNPYNSEPYYNLGLSLLHQGKKEEAFDAFYKAVWTSAEQEMGFYYLGALSAQKGEYDDALEFVERSLVKNSRNVKARGLKAYLLNLTGKQLEADEFLQQSIQQDPFDYVSRFEAYGVEDIQTLALMRDNPNTFIEAAVCYSEYGNNKKAADILRQCKAQHPMVGYYQAYYAQQYGDEGESKAALNKAAKASPLYCFPNKLTDIAVLSWVIEAAPKDGMAAYYLGNLWYDKRQYEPATKLWEKAAKLKPEFPTVWRNLALAYYNKQVDPQKAQQAMENAFRLDTSDARIFLELDQLYKKRGLPPEKRLALYEQYQNTFEQRDDLWVEHITLLNLLGKYQQAYDRIMSHKFHPWEGGEGKITAQYTLSLQQLALEKLAGGNAQEARDLLEQALVFPENLGEGKLAGAKDNDIYYYLGCAYEGLGEVDKANLYWQKATLGNQEPAGVMFYYDQPADMILYQGLAWRKLGNEKKAVGCFHKLVDYGEQHIFDEVKIDYFAVSLPDLQLFDEDLNLKNKAHCNYLIALGSYGLGERQRAAESCAKTLEIDCVHIGAVRHRTMFGC